MQSICIDSFPLRWDSRPLFLCLSFKFSLLWCWLPLLSYFFSFWSIVCTILGVGKIKSAKETIVRKGGNSWTEAVGKNGRGRWRTRAEHGSNRRRKERTNDIEQSEKGYWLPRLRRSPGLKRRSWRGKMKSYRKWTKEVKFFRRIASLEWTVQLFNFFFYWHCI